jgi:hypothetical protein
MTEDANTPPPSYAGGKFRKGVSGNPGGKKRVVVAPAQSSDAQIENTAPKQRRYGFQPGQSGNPAGKPKGARHKTTLAMEALLEGEADTITRKAIELAKAGDLIAIRIVMDRLLPVRRERSVSLDMPKINAASDLIAATSALTAAVADGQITPGEAASLSQLVGNTAKAVETFELADRLARLEEQMAAKGGN